VLFVHGPFGILCQLACLWPIHNAWIEASSAVVKSVLIAPDTAAVVTLRLVGRGSSQHSIWNLFLLIMSFNSSSFWTAASMAYRVVVQPFASSLFCNTSSSEMMRQAVHCLGKELACFGSSPHPQRDGVVFSADRGVVTRRRACDPEDVEAGT